MTNKTPMEEVLGILRQANSNYKPARGRYLVLNSDIELKALLNHYIKKGRQIGFDEGVKKTMDACSSTFGEELKQAKKEFLSDPSIVEIDENQGLPSPRNAVNKSYNDYMLGQEDMIRDNFRRVKKKDGV